MKSGTDLNAYFERIGYSGPKAATPEVLKELHRLHPQAIAFENLNPLTGTPVLLDPESLAKKLVHQNRGGYCFEQNLLFKQVLEAIGFRVKGLGARILWNRPEGAITPRGHMLLLVETGGERYIADVGFGGNTLTAPIQLNPDAVRQTPHEPARIIKNDPQEYRLEFEVRGEWKPLYRFDLQEQYRQDYEIHNWYLSNHPESHFVTGLIAARAETGRRLVLQNNRFSVHHLNGGSESHYAETVAELRSILQSWFLIDLDAIPALNEKLEQLVDPPLSAEASAQAGPSPPYAAKERHKEG